MEKPVENDKVTATPIPGLPIFSDIISELELPASEGVTLVKETDGITIKEGNISNKFAHTITLELPREYKGIIMMEEGGKYVPVPHKIINNEAKITVSKKGKIVLLEDNPVNLKDIEKNFFKKEIELLAKRGIVTGYENKFNPNATSSRAEYFTMLAKGLGLDKGQENKFVDAKGKWYESDVSALSELGFVSGDENGNANGSNLISRQEVFTVLGRLLEQFGYEATSNEIPFNDKDRVAGYAAPYVALLAELNIVNGNNGNVNPTANITKGEIAKVLSLTLQKIGYM